VLLLSDIYHAQETLEKQTTNFLAAISVPRSDRETPAYRRDEMRSISLYLNDVVPAEERLLQMYDRALTQLEPRK
jgi:hypothetical protein